MIAIFFCFGARLDDSAMRKCRAARSLDGINERVVRKTLENKVTGLRFVFRRGRGAPLLRTTAREEADGDTEQDAKNHRPLLPLASALSKVDCMDYDATPQRFEKSSGLIRRSNLGIATRNLG